jgi:hypothetical protein
MSTRGINVVFKTETHSEPSQQSWWHNVERSFGNLAGCKREDMDTWSLEDTEKRRIRQAQILKSRQLPDANGGWKLNAHHKDHSLMRLKGEGCKSTCDFSQFGRLNFSNYSFTSESGANVYLQGFRVVVRERNLSVLTLVGEATTNKRIKVGKSGTV